MRKLHVFSQAIALRCICGISIANALDGGDRQILLFCKTSTQMNRRHDWTLAKNKREIVDNLLVDAYSY
ncbi:hypothetical protein [Tolypothrix sp. VBCCA 56010]|uniref:hypothetical protein n=1 Tax=Tolypothrix sp. VBCCA 56010 TaxID=3137731 RepID=UPI003D7CA8B7